MKGRNEDALKVFGAKGTKEVLEPQRWGNLPSRKTS